MGNVPAVFLPQTGAGDVKLGEMLRGYEAALGGQFGQGGGTVTTLAVGEETSGGGVTTLRFPHD
jgi:hypothetical protein